MIYEDVSDVGGASEQPEGKDTNEPPPVNGETLDSSVSDSEASSVLSEEGKEIKEQMGPSILGMVEIPERGEKI